jgi:hypothetical protein
MNADIVLVLKFITWRVSILQSSVKTICHYAWLVNSLTLGLLKVDDTVVQACMLNNTSMVCIN